MWEWENREHLMQSPIFNKTCGGLVPGPHEPTSIEPQAGSILETNVCIENTYCHSSMQRGPFPSSLSSVHDGSQKKGHHILAICGVRPIGEADELQIYSGCVSWR